MNLPSYQTAAQKLLAATTPAVRALLAHIKADQLYPPFLAKVIAALEVCDGIGQDFYITCGERTWPEQHELWLKGRRNVKGEKIVTKVDSGDSAHNYAVAVDAAYDLDNKKPGLQPSWAMNWMQVWADHAVVQGLDAGYYWKNFVDGPHAQLNLKLHGLTVKDLKTKFLVGGKLAVFNWLDSYQW